MSKIIRHQITIAVCVFATLASVVAFGQDRPGRPPRNRGFSASDAAGQDRGPRRPFFGEQTFDFVGSEMRFGGKTVKGAPYSATVITESVQTLGDGNRITRTSTATVSRDSEGRTRRDQTLNRIGPFEAAGEARQMTFINDPVAGVQYVLDARNRTAQKMKPWGGPPPDVRPPSSSEARTESLGTQTIEGVVAEGTRSTVTIPAGQIGNAQPLEIVSERWYSPELQVVVLSKHTDPRMGEHTYRLTNINRSEPVRSAFDVPADYTVKETPFNRGPGMRGRRPNEQ